jgi:hypothetical protein
MHPVKAVLFLRAKFGITLTEHLQRMGKSSKLVGEWANPPNGYYWNVIWSSKGKMGDGANATIAAGGTFGSFADR